MGTVESLAYSRHDWWRSSRSSYGCQKIRELNKEQKSLSLPDWLGDYYNSDILRVGTGLILLFNIFYISAQFVAGARIFEYLLGMDYTVGLILITVVVVLYVFGGGALADIYTDAVQVILMAIAGIIVFVSGIVIFGTVGLQQHFPESWTI